MKRMMHPPKKALALLRWFCREDFLEEIEGDLTEVFKKQYSDDPRKAKWRFVWSVIRYFRPEFIKSFRNISQPNGYNMYKSYFKIGWRNLLRSKGYSAINIIGLSVGMTTAFLIGMWLWDELTFNYVHTNHDEIAGVWVTTTHEGKMETGPAICLPLGAELKDNYGDQFKALALASWNWNHALSVPGKTVILKEGMYTEAAFPEMFSIQMIEGNSSKALTMPYSIVLSESTAKTLFGNENAIGRPLRLDNTHDVKVTGVYKDLPASSEFRRVKLLLPWSLHEKEAWVRNNLTNWENHSWQLFAQIRTTHSMSSISEMITAVEKKYNKTGNPTILLHPMNRWHLFERFENGISTGGRIQYVWLFSIVGASVLLLACINFMNLSTARSEKRAREVGVRKAIGSGRGQLITQFLLESFLITSMASLMSIVWIALFLPTFNELTGKEIVFPVDRFEIWTIAFLFWVITAVSAGSYPAFYLSALKPLNVLKGITQSGKRTVFMRRTLVVLQFTISISLVLGTLIVLNQIRFGKERSVGYSQNRLVYTSIIPEMKTRYDQLRNELFKTGAIEEMSQSSGPTTDIWSNETDYSWDGKAADTQPLFGTLQCTHDFGNTIGWKIKEGRDFSRDFPSDSSAVIINESAAEIIGVENIIGTTIRHDAETYHVIGVIEDMVMESPYSAIRPVIFSLDYKWTRVTTIRLSDTMPLPDAINRVEQLFKKMSPENVFEFRFAGEEYEAKFTSENRVGKLAEIFAAMAIFIACLGLLGLSSFIIEQRQKEIGIRKILGASVLQIWQSLSRHFVILIIISCVIAIPLSFFYMNNWLVQFQYRTTISWEIPALACGGALAIALLTVSFQSVKAAMMNPAKSLRSE